MMIALLTRVVHLDRTPQIDELYHILAARSWLEDGTLRIGDGVYTRSWLFTVVVAGFIRFFGDSLAVARLPSAIAGSLLVVALFLWVRREAGRAAGWISGALLCFDSSAIHLSQLVRFYAPQSFLFLAGAVGIYALTERRVTGRRAVGVGGLVALAFALALHLQVTTLIGLAGIGLWVAIRLGMQWTDTVRTATRGHRPGHRLFSPLVIAAIVVGGAIVAAQTPLVSRLWASYRSASLWLRPWQDDVWWYHWLFAGEYRALWYLLPLAVVAAAAFRPTATAFSTVVFGAALLLHSFAAAKQTRFISYAMPFFAAIWGIALADAAPRIAAWIRDVVVLLPSRFARGPAGSIVTMTVVAGIFTFAAYGTPAFTKALRRIAPAEGPRSVRANWRAATPLLRQLADSVEVVVSDAGPKAFYYLERLDVGLGASALADLNGGRSSPEFSVDYRTGRPLISRPESLQRLMDCHRSGLVILERSQLSVELRIPPPTTEYLVTHTEEVPVPASWRMRVFRWHHAAAAARADCSTRETTDSGNEGRRIRQATEPAITP